jgi:1-acyl-sn-glycerol-3-phosphate acyltransferase
MPGAMTVTLRKLLNMRIQNKLFRQWRICATGIAFLTFMVGSIFVTIVAIPIIRLLPGSVENKRRKILQLIHCLFKLFIKYSIFLKVIETFEVDGLEDIKCYDSHIFIANHPTLIDVVALMSCIPFCNCIIKKSLLKHIYFGRIARAAGYIVNDRATQLINDCEKNFQAGRSLIVFPEGTRSPAYGLRTFKRGAAQIALRTGAPIVLVVITCDPPTLSKGQPWYRVPERPLRFKLHFHRLSTFPAEVQQKHHLPLKVRVLNRYFEDFFRERLHVPAQVD